MIGYYNYTVVLTYLGLLASLGSAASAINGNFRLSMIFMLICGFADMFDGVIARTDKKRSENAKRFGVQIDSLCDMSCFCCLPAVFMLCLCGVSALSLIAGGMIMLSGVIRLGYFNVQEINRELENEGRREYYDGLPVTASALILPPAALLGALLGANWFSPAVMIIAAVLNVTRVKIKKPRGK
ncbi:MAG: CDP-alcohol phosphatidyltransferase family protein, partial [Clostridia bacterium]|nr:CDP-alcohol phosphatidyltransferase family protein [Clostridia bacterium]